MLLVRATQAVELKAKLFRGFADLSRLTILAALQQGPMTVGQLVTTTGLSQSNTSNHLGCLRDCGLVVATQQGKHSVYQLSDERVAGLLSLADELLSDVATGVYQCTRFDKPCEED